MNICKAPAPAQVMAQLFFGANIPNARGPEFGEETYVTPEAFAQYLEHVTPHFPGFTITTAQGYWKGKPETVRVLSILMPDTDAGRNQIRYFAEQYKTLFAQEAVAYAFTPCSFQLDCWPFGPVKTYHTEGKGY